MTDFIKRVFTNTQITIEELTKFVVEYCELFDEKNISSQQIQGIIQAISQGFFDLRYACKIYAIKKDIKLDLLHGKHGELINIYI